MKRGGIDGRRRFAAGRKSSITTAKAMTSPNPSPRPPQPPLGRTWRDLRSAVGFLTVLPVAPSTSDPRSADDDGGFLCRAMVWFPVVGAAIGGTAGLVLIAADEVGMGTGVAVALAIATPVALTGALHEDGLADVADGFGGGWSRDRKLQILRDSRIGAYGVVALILAFAIRFGALSDIPDATAAAVALVCAGALSRAVIPAVMRFTPSARNDGLAAAAGFPSRTNVGVAVGMALTLAVVSLPTGAAVASVVAAIASAAVVGFIAVRQIGGHTGDVLGATQVTAELAVLVTLSALMS